MIKISVIIPIYNTSIYLKECLDSVLNQSLDDIEVICINDGSTDTSLEVIESYASKDDRIKIINQENKGLGAARNVGINHAMGKYILFLDSDDFIEKDSLIDIYDLAELKSLDLLMFKIINFNDKTYNKFIGRYFEMNFLNAIVNDEVFNWFSIKNRLFDISVTAPGKLFKRDLIKNIKFPENLIFEDNLFFIKTFLKAKRVYYYENYIYNRRIREDSITHSYFDKFSDCIIIYDLIEKFIIKNDLYDMFSEQLFNRKCSDLFHRYKMVNDAYKLDFYIKLKENFSNHKNKLTRDGTIKVCSERSLVIFNSCLSSNTPEEFELMIELYDMSRKYDKLKLDYNIATRKYNKELTKLNNDLEHSIDEIKTLKKSTSWRVTKIFRICTNFIKKIINNK